MAGLDDTIASTLQTFRKKRIEPDWEKLDRTDAVRYVALWEGLREVGVTTLGLPEARSGIDLDAASRYAILSCLGAAAPSLAFGLISHATSLALVDEATAGAWPAPLDGLTDGPRLALVGSPLDARPTTSFELAANGHLSLSGAQRVAMPYPDWIVVPAREGARQCVCIVRADAPGVRFDERPSSHGLRLIPFGDLVLENVEVPAAQVLPWPDSGFSSNEADGLVTALLAGVASELADRAAGYAVVRRQGGKMISEHHAVQQLVGPIHFAGRPLRALALEALGARRSGDGGASGFAAQTVRSAALDAIQTLGGYGYMEDYRVERYLRDANTLETFWVHAAARLRDIARARFTELTNQGARP
jgi:alkylation response protein AidB-like acyl-CoA dehydrogenase